MKPSAVKYQVVMSIVAAVAETVLHSIMVNLSNVHVATAVALFLKAIHTTWTRRYTKGDGMDELNIGKIEQLTTEPIDGRVVLKRFADYQAMESELIRLRNLVGRILLIVESGCNTEQDAFDNFREIEMRIKASKQYINIYSSETISSVPCDLCGGEVIEFSIPNDIWNKVIRLDGREHDKEYLCVNCFFDALRKALGLPSV